jgi:integrase
MPTYHRKLSDCTKWFYKFDFKGKLYRSRAIYLTKEEAKGAEAKAYQEARKHKRYSIKPQEVTLLQAVNERLDYIQARKGKKYYNDNKRYVKILLDTLGDKALDLVKRNDIETLLQEESKRGAYTVNAMLRCYKALFNYTIDSHELDIKNPCIKIKLFSVEKRLKFIPSDEDIQEILDHCTQEQKHLIQFLMETGCRINEALKVTGSDIMGDSIILTTRKSNNSDLIPRKLPLPEFLKDFKLNPDQRIFSSWTEQPKFLERKIKSLGQKQWGFHSLRHRKASLWSKEGKPLFEIMILLGHKSLVTTQRYLQLLS